MRAGHDINAGAGNDIFIAAGRDMDRNADNDIREHAGHDRTTTIDRTDTLTNRIDLKAAQVKTN